MPAVIVPLLIIALVTMNIHGFIFDVGQFTVEHPRGVFGYSATVELFILVVIMPIMTLAPISNDPRSSACFT